MMLLRKSTPLNLMMVAAMAAGQEPKINSFLPGAITPGKATDITLSGENLGALQDVWTSFAARTSIVPSAGDPKTSVVRFELAKDAPVGVGAFRVASSNGVSALHLLMVDDLPSVRESNSNQSTLPVGIDGICNEAGFDFFRFGARKGRPLSIETVAQRMGSLADTVIRVLDEKGREVAFCDDDGAGRDSRFVFLAPASGEYTLELRDMNYGGGDGYRYRLRIGEFPLIRTVFPPAIQRGKTQTVQWLGPDVHGLKPQTVSHGTVSASRKGQSGFGVVISSEHEESLEVEPNEELKTANGISNVVSGRFEQDDDRDFFRFEAIKDQRLVFEAASRSLNSPCDVLMRILKPDGSRLMESAEATITNVFKETGSHFLELQELTGKGASDFVYRLEITALEPGFDLMTETNRFEEKDGRLTLKVTAARRDYNGPITLTVNEEWFEAEDKVIAEKKNETVIKLKPTEACPRGKILELRLTGNARIGDREVSQAVSTMAALRKAFPRMGTFPPGLDGVVSAFVPARAAP